MIEKITWKEKLFNVLILLTSILAVTVVAIRVVFPEIQLPQFSEIIVFMSWLVSVFGGYRYSDGFREFISSRLNRTAQDVNEFTHATGSRVIDRNREHLEEVRSDIKQSIVDSPKHQRREIVRSDILAAALNFRHDFYYTYTREDIAKLRSHLAKLSRLQDDAEIAFNDKLTDIYDGYMDCFKELQATILKANGNTVLSSDEDQQIMQIYLYKTGIQDRVNTITEELKLRLDSKNIEIPPIEIDEQRIRSAKTRLQESSNRQFDDPDHESKPPKDNKSQSG